MASSSCMPLFSCNSSIIPELYLSFPGLYIVKEQCVSTLLWTLHCSAIKSQIMGMRLLWALNMPFEILGTLCFKEKFFLVIVFIVTNYRIK